MKNPGMKKLIEKSKKRRIIKQFRFTYAPIVINGIYEMNRSIQFERKKREDLRATYCDIIHFTDEYRKRISELYRSHG